LVREYGRYGHRQIIVLLRHEGWRVNAKPLARTWRQERLGVPQKQPKRGGVSLDRLTDGSCVRLRPECQSHAWANAFLHDRAHDGQALKTLAVLDEFTRQCLAIRVARKMDSPKVLTALAGAFLRHGVLEHIRSDNGSEFTAEMDRR
jgi:putative transposase